MKKNWLYINLSIGITLYIITGLITAILVATPIKLTSEEIAYYTQVAENVWYKGLQSVTQEENIIINYDLNEKTVQISNEVPNKQNVTVDFSDGENKVIINKPNTSFIDCFFFFGALWTFLIFIIQGLISAFIVEVRKSKAKKSQN